MEEPQHFTFPPSPDPSLNDFEALHKCNIHGFRLLDAYSLTFAPSSFTDFMKKRKAQGNLHQRRASKHANKKQIIDPSRPYETRTPLTEFHYFTKLAKELRHMIYSEFLPSRQIIRIAQRFLTQEETDANGDQKATVLSVAQGSYIPSVLVSICQDSFDYINYKYPRLFEAELGGRCIRMNFNTDVLCFENPMALSDFYGASLPNHVAELKYFGHRHDMTVLHTKLQHIAIGGITYLQYAIGAVLNRCQALKTVSLGEGEGSIRIEKMDDLLDVMTGKKLMRLDWQIHQQFKTVEKGNIPEVQIFRADAFNFNMGQGDMAREQRRRDAQQAAARAERAMVKFQKPVTMKMVRPSFVIHSVNPKNLLLAAPTQMVEASTWSPVGYD